MHPCIRCRIECVLIADRRLISRRPILPRLLPLLVTSHPAIPPRTRANASERVVAVRRAEKSPSVVASSGKCRPMRTTWALRLSKASETSPGNLSSPFPSSSCPLFPCNLLVFRISARLHVAIAVPGAILDNTQSPELRTYVAGQVRFRSFLHDSLSSAVHESESSE
jgi:hypothetical protein